MSLYSKEIDWYYWHLGQYCLPVMSGVTRRNLRTYIKSCLPFLVGQDKMSTIEESRNASTLQEARYIHNIESKKFY